MNEEEYIELQNLLTKYRVHCLKKIGDSATDTDARHSYFMQVRHIDNLRNKIDFIIESKETEVVSDD